MAVIEAIFAMTFWDAVKLAFAVWLAVWLLNVLGQVAYMLIYRRPAPRCAPGRDDAEHSGGSE